MVYTTDAALYEAPEALHGVGMDIADHVDFGRVVDAPMGVAERFAFLLEIGELVVGHVLVGVDRRFWQDMFTRHIKKLLIACHAWSLRHNLALALDNTGDAGFVLPLSRPSQPLTRPPK